MRILRPCFTGFLQSLIYKKQDRAQVLMLHEYIFPLLKFLCSLRTVLHFFQPHQHSITTTPRAQSSSVGCSVGWNHVPGKQAMHREIKWLHSLLLFPSPLAAMAIPHLLLAGLQFLLSSWKRKVAASCPPAAIDIQRAALLPAQDKQKKEMASVSAPLNQRDTGMSALSRTRALDRQALSVE